tara:strand:- start:757 stop:1104 length:348 start_codon:yes stop_codon:yes gene_type:complete
MTYAIAHVIYGIPLNSNDDEVKKSDELEDLIEDEPEGMLGYYSGSAPWIPTAFGVELHEFDECNHHIDLDTINLQPTAEQLAQFNTEWANLPAEIKEEIIKSYGLPRVFLLWSTS